MMRFFRENWIWIAAPIVVVFVGVVLLMMFSNDDAQAPFRYAIF